MSTLIRANSLKGPGDILVLIWKVLFDALKPGPEGDFTLYFVDFSELIKLEDYFTLTPKYVDDLQELIKSQFNYNVIGNVKSSTLP